MRSFTALARCTCICAQHAGTDARSLARPTPDLAPLPLLTPPRWRGWQACWLAGCSFTCLIPTGPGARPSMCHDASGSWQTQTGTAFLACQSLSERNERTKGRWRQGVLWGGRWIGCGGRCPERGLSLPTRASDSQGLFSTAISIYIHIYIYIYNIISYIV